MTARQSQDRHAQICDAAIALLASKGVSGLTPRAVDRQLAWPVGTTASVFRTRSALVQAAAERLILLDTVEAASFRASAAGIAAVLERSLASERRDRLLARLELFLLTARSPEFATMRWARELFLAGAEAQLRTAEVAAPRLAAVGVVSLVEGLSIHALLAPDLKRRELLALIRSMFSGFFKSSLPAGAKRL